eukprot:TRINITY_DN17338_c0_g1_i1.p1 TRINITY_DN17338_c0_g1~~TRINITY_DN17338_c0_g1_i1.p1  ORF type:complete len:179 (+),score=15.22 TRINITY_DN17338_c0_g1_i1:154-690(+)
MATQDAGATTHHKPTNIAKDTPHPELKEHGKSPGSFLHQRGHATGFNRYFSARLLPMYPMIAAVGLGVGLAGYTMYHALIVSPEVHVFKDRRSGVPELEDPEEMHRRGVAYKHAFPLRSGAKADNAVVQNLHAFSLQPPVLPGDDAHPSRLGNTDFGPGSSPTKSFGPGAGSNQATKH